MSVRNLERLIRPASVLLVAAASRHDPVAAVVARNLSAARFSGALMMVGGDGNGGGLPVFSDIASLPCNPDLAVIAMPPDKVAATISELGARGTRAAVVLGADPSGPDAPDPRLQQAIGEAAAPYLLRVVGPRSTGIMVPALGLDASCSHVAARPGRIAFVSQSGTMISTLLDWAKPRGIGFSCLISLGDMADVDVADMLDYLATDPPTSAILLYIETLTGGRKFMSAARAAARSKPVLVLKAGGLREPEGRPQSHCGALAGTEPVFDAAFRRAGVLRVGTVAELLEAAETLAATRDQIGDRLAILTNSRAAGFLAAAALAAAGHTPAPLSGATITALRAVLPVGWVRRNPIDIGAAASAKNYRDAITALVRDRDIDAIAVLNAPTPFSDRTQVAQAVADAVQAAAPGALRGRNIFAAWLGEDTAQIGRRPLAQAGIARYATPDGAIAGFMHSVRHHRNRELLIETPPARVDAFIPDIASARRTITEAIGRGETWLDPDAAAGVLKAYRIPLAAGRRAADPEQAAAVAAEIGFPVVVKIRSPDIVAKGDIGGVALNLGNVDQVRREAEAMLHRIAAARSMARVDGFLVQPMIQRPGAVELLAGLVEDSIFGPMVVFGQSGVAGEIAEECSLELPPLNDLLARRLIARTRAARLLQERRGLPPADLDAVAAVLIRLGQLATDLPEVSELDLYPMLADAGGVIALDVRLRVARRAAGAPRLAIAPYPQHLVSVERLRDGTVLDLRPLRPEDEPLLLELAAKMSPDDLRLRFFTPMRGLSHAVAARLSQLDYDRELALIALQGQVPVGVVHYFADPDNQRAEYAIAVRSDWKGRGVGYVLMNRLIELARRRGIAELAGEVLRENQPMLDMCRELGFTIAVEPADPGVMSVRKALNKTSTGCA